MEDEFRKDFEELLRLMDAGKLQDFKKKAYECLPVDIAEGLEEIEDNARVLRLFRMLPKDISSDVFSYMNSDQQQFIAESASSAELKALVDDMFLDDTVDFLEEMPANVVKKVLQNADESTRKMINQFLNFCSLDSSIVFDGYYDRTVLRISTGHTYSPNRMTGYSFMNLRHNYTD